MVLKIIRQLFKYLVCYKRDLAIVTIALCVTALSLLMFGQGFKRLVDIGLNTKNVATTNDAILFICFLIIVFGMGSFFRSYFINNIAEKVTNNIKIDAFNNLIKRDSVFFEDLKIGDLISCLSSDIEQISKLIVNFLSFFIRNFIMLIGGIVMMFSQSPKLSFIVVIMVPSLLIPLLKLGKHLRSLAKDSVNMQGKIAGEIEETFVNIHTIHSYNQENSKIENFRKQINLYLNSTSSKLRLRSIFFASAISIIMLCITIVIWAGSNDIISGNITSGHMLSFIYYSIITGMSAGGIAELFNDVHTPLAAAERVFNLVNSNIANDTISINDDQIILDKDKIIEFDQVTFAYPTRPSVVVLDNLSLSIPLHKFIGIVGKSGAGKSTILQLLIKFYSNYNGSITIADHNITTTNASQLRNLIAYVPQMPSIFSGTIRSNIAFSNPDASTEEIMKAADLSGVTEFAKTLQCGLDTEIGERGVRLSGGQKQRISIARAILYNPQILLLDEATSSLDSNSEHIILDNLLKLMVGRTIISIAHRIASVEQADEILLIEQGQLLAKGKHQELITCSKLYKLLCEEQLVYS